MRNLILSILASFAFVGQAQAIEPAAYEKLAFETKQKVRSAIIPVLERYCGDPCQVVEIKVQVDEEIVVSDDLGFEAVMDQGSAARPFVDSVTVDVQIDDRVNGVNQERLESILRNHLRSFGHTINLVWNRVELPRIGQSGGILQNLKDKLKQRITGSLQRIIQRYCPHQCILENVDIVGTMVTVDEADNLISSQKVPDSQGRSFMRVDNVEIDLSMDENLSEMSRSQISGLMQNALKFVSPANLNVSVTAFPEPYAKKIEKARESADDPYGLNRLRQMLVMFRDLAGTKEIITNTNTETSNSESRNNTLNETNNSSVNSETLSKTKQQLNNNNTDSSGLGSWTMEDMVLWGGIALLLIVLAAVAIGRYAKANRDASEMILSSRMDQHSTRHDEDGEEGIAGGGTDTFEQRRDMREKVNQRLKLQELKDELIDLFIQHPKIAKETFSRFLKEDGVEETAKYVYIFGQLIVFELLDDPSLRRDLYLLSEYMHNADFEFTIEEEIELLVKLKTRCTASEIRVLTRRSSETFDFLTKLDSTQIFNLIAEESPQVQTIVLTQLGRKTRLAVFDMYEGDAKVKLMANLSAADTIPKEFLFNVAKALSKKVLSRPEFDAENLRTTDILLDLLEKASLDEQIELMVNLQQNNPDTARSLKMKLVTVEMLPYLKDGHLLEIILGMEREDLLAFLMGTKDHIRDLILRKAPEELADSWLEDMEAMASIDEQNYQLVLMKVVNRIRSLANSGVINILDINEMIFQRVGDSSQEFHEDPTTSPTLSQGASVA